MNMLVWWFVLMVSAWLIVAWLLWRTSIVVSEEEGGTENG